MFIWTENLFNKPEPHITMFMLVVIDLSIVGPPYQIHRDQQCLICIRNIALIWLIFFTLPLNGLFSSFYRVSILLLISMLISLHQHRSFSYYTKPDLLNDMKSNTSKCSNCIHPLYYLCPTYNVGAIKH